MFRRAMASVTMKVSLATLLLAFSVVAAAGSMRCLLGLPMESCTPVVAKPAVPKDQNCCPSKAEAPKPVEEKSKCCCIDAMKKSAVDFGVGKIVDFRLDFPILSAPAIIFEANESRIIVQQVRWPEVHGPPGIDRHPGSPRAPPAA